MGAAAAAAVVAAVHASVVCKSVGLHSMCPLLPAVAVVAQVLVRWVVGISGVLQLPGSGTLLKVVVLGSRKPA